MDSIDMAKKTAKKAAKKSVAKKTPVKKSDSTKKKAAGKKAADKGAAGGGGDGAVKGKAVAKKKPKKRAASSKSGPKRVRLKAYWGVFNQSLRRVAIFEFNEKKQAEKKAEELTKSGKSPHFVQPVKEAIS
jgi:hypothetical protein